MLDKEFNYRKLWFFRATYFLACWLRIGFWVIGLSTKAIEKNHLPSPSMRFNAYVIVSILALGTETRKKVEIRLDVQMSDVGFEKPRWVPLHFSQKKTTTNFHLKSPGFSQHFKYHSLHPSRIFFKNYINYLISSVCAHTFTSLSHSDEFWTFMHLVLV